MTQVRIAHLTPLVEDVAAAVRADYQHRRAARAATVAALDQRHQRYGLVRLALAACAVGILVIQGSAGLTWALAAVVAFGGVVLLHGRVLEAKGRAASAVAFYDRGLARLAHAWIGTGRSGETYRPADHLFAEDLDVFGRGSLFELLATVRTQAGEEMLAGWLVKPAVPAVARARQDAVKELSGRLDLREAVSVLGDQLRIAVDARLLRRWSGTPVTLGGTAVRVAVALLVAASLAALAWWLGTGSYGGVAMALLFTQLATAQLFRARVLGVVAAVDEPSHDLDVLAGLLRRLEQESFTSAELRRLQQVVIRTGRPASAEIGRLAQLVAVLASRRNILFAALAGLMMWATQWAFAIEAWRRRAGAHIPEWLQAVGEFEALLALGTFAAEHPTHVFPELVDGPPLLDATDVAHPALPPAAVANTLCLDRGGVRLAIVSGSNMSGKSTFMRALGANVVLAQMGSPVRATRLRLSPLAIGAAMRVQDSLTDGRSRFFAEITRLKAVVDLAAAHDGQVLFLLDEILSGTNSHDRRIGAEALVTGLVRSGAIGLVTTHDLALGEIAGRLPDQAVNVHFEDRFTDGVLTFDYRLRPGVVRTSNALELMRSIGLDI